VPTYEYQCDRCGENFEIFQKFSDKPLRRHPQCGGAVEKVFHPRGVVFKGSGFYVTDSRSKNGSSTEKPSEKSAKTSENGSSSVPAEKTAVTTSDSKSD
jgi:putative FmdB family regulatory protein